MPSMVLSEGMRKMRTKEKRQQRATKPQSQHPSKRVRLIGSEVNERSLQGPIDNAADRDEAAVNDLVADFNEGWKIFNDGWKMSLNGIFRAGQALVALQNHLDGQRGAYRNVVSERLKISSRTAERLVAIASDAVLKATHVSHPERLPRSWGTLYEMSKLPEHRLQQALDSGKIDADTQRKEVEAIYEECRDKIKFARVTKAFRVLREFHTEYPDAEDFATRVFDEFEEGENAMCLDSVAQVIEWAKKMSDHFSFIISERERLMEAPRVNVKMKAGQERLREKERKRLEAAAASIDAVETAQ